MFEKSMYLYIYIFVFFGDISADMVEEKVMEETEQYVGGGGSGFLMIGMSTLRRFNRRRIRTGVGFVPLGGRYI